MSLLKTLLAATLLADPADALAAVKDALATQVLTVEDLATASESDLGAALSRQGAFASIWSVDDVIDRFKGSREEAALWWKENSYRLGDLLGQRGNDALDDMLNADGLSLDDTDEDTRTAYESVRGGYWYVDQVQGGERYTIAKYLTEDEAQTLAEGDDTPFNGSTGVDADLNWTLRIEGEPDQVYDSYREAFDRANGGQALPFAILPPLAEREEGEGA